MVRRSTRPRLAEIGFHRRDLARRYGRRRRGKRLRCGVPHGHYKAITFVSGLRLRGLVAPKAYDRAMNAETFEACEDAHRV
jgi:hypothetical protein